MKEYCAKLISNDDTELYIAQFPNGEYRITDDDEYGDEIFFKRRKDAEEAIAAYTRDVKYTDIAYFLDCENGEFIARSEIEFVEY